MALFVRRSKRLNVLAQYRSYHQLEKTVLARFTPAGSIDRGPLELSFSMRALVSKKPMSKKYE